MRSLLFLLLISSFSFAENWQDFRGVSKLSVLEQEDGTQAALFIKGDSAKWIYKRAKEKGVQHYVEKIGKKVFHELDYQGLTCSERQSRGSGYKYLCQKAFMDI